MSHSQELPRELPQMDIYEIAQYLSNDSVWAYDLRCQGISQEAIEFLVPNEMAAMGREGRIRYIGAHPYNSMQLDVIPRNYWVTMAIDPDRVWDKDNYNYSFTARRSYVPSGLVIYNHGTAPRLDVERAWPKAPVFSNSVGRLSRMSAWLLRFVHRILS